MTTRLPFANRAEAGRLLGEKLVAEMELSSDTLVLGLVRGGAVLAEQLAQVAGLAWDVLIVRKIGAPGQQEYAAGAYAESGALMINEYARRSMHIDDTFYELGALRAEEECKRLHRDLRGDADQPDLGGKELILTDDGMATGLSMQAAITAAQSAEAKRVIVAVPVLAPDALAWLKRHDMEHCFLACPPGFHAVGQYYADFTPVSGAQVRELLIARQQGTR
jgi:putative phosphoribosyl transferase